jgi:hypothetical protein
VTHTPPAGVTGPLALLEELNPQEVEAAAAATRQARTMKKFL